ncbi:MAG: glucose-1-phosphate thymidylyltransferase, partial [Spirochaetota bacterium]
LSLILFVQNMKIWDRLYIACVEEIAFHKGWIDRARLLATASTMKTEYGEYLSFIAENKGP